MSELRLAWASHDAARFACENWHYAGILPTGKLVKVGVWEDDEFKGVVLFSRGASPWLGRRYDLDHTEVCELTRVALRDHDAPVSRILSIALRMLKRSSPGIRLVVSFADPEHDHVGVVYQAANWIYTGQSAVHGGTLEHFVQGKWRHRRGAWPLMQKLGIDPKTVPWRTMSPKHRYLYPLDPEIRALCELLRQPYPRLDSVARPTSTGEASVVPGGESRFDS